MTNPAQSSRLAKERNPDDFCPKCLWRLSSGPCPRHQIAPTRYCLKCHVHEPLTGGVLCRWCDKEREVSA